MREHLGVASSSMQDWYDRKVHVQHFNVGDEVYILNLRMYQGKCPKWIHKYSYTRLIVKKINIVTYVIHCDNWHEKERIIHVDKLKLRQNAAKILEQEKIDC